MSVPKGPGQARVASTPAPAVQAHIPGPPPRSGRDVADELARTRARLEAAEREIGRLRRARRSRGGCCRDEAAQAWADNDVLHDRLRRAQEAHRRVSGELTTALQQAADLRAQLDQRPTPQITVHNPPDPQPALLWRLRRRNR